MFKQEIGLPVSINPHPYWRNLFLYLFESKYVQQLISKGYPCSYKFHGRCRFMDGLCRINNDRLFSSSYKYLDTKQLELKLQHQEKDKTFLDLDISAEDSISLYKLLDKRNKFPFFVIRMLYRSSNVPSSIFYGSIFSEFLQIARCTLRLTKFIPKAPQLYTRMVTQGGNKASILRQLKKHSKDTLKHI